jgi:arabinoxylan arabinofuranohydrolase
MKLAKKKFKICLLFLLMTNPFVGFSQQSPANKKSAYLFVYFTGNGKGEEAIRFALSPDGFNYRAINQNKPVLDVEKISSAGGVRDPHILRGHDGKTFYMVATDMQVTKNGWGPNEAMVLLKSTDLVNWKSTIVNIPQTFPEMANVNRVWAPQSIYDPFAKKYMIYWSMRFGKDPDKIYYAYANKDFTGFESAPKQLFFSPDNAACIDGDIVYKDGKYHLFFKTEDQKPGIKKAVSSQLTGGYKMINQQYLQKTTDPVEGAGTFKLNDSDTWILMYDVYTKGKYQFTKTKDLENFTVIDDKITMNFHPRHGTVISINSAEAATLVNKWVSVNDVILSATAPKLKEASIDRLDVVNRILTLGYSNLSELKPKISFFPYPSVKVVKAPSKSNAYTVTIGKQSSKTFQINLQKENNRVLPGLYADPFIIFAKKTQKFYIYPTSDGFTGWSGTYFKTFSSTDLTNWKDEGIILDLPKQVNWADKNAWAPCIIEHKVGNSYKYFYYFTAAQKIGVAVADNPTGPFTDSGKQFINQYFKGIKRGQHIDPDIFNDPKTGKNYLYWGNGYMAAAELNSDMISIDTTSVKILTPTRSYNEGTHVFYRNGIYYFTWSENDTRSEDYQVRYGTSTSPMGPITLAKDNLVLIKNAALGIYGTGHHSVIQIPGKDEWYIVYHRFNYPNGIQMGRAAGYNREVCIDKLEFNTDGTIKQVIPTHIGIAPILK